MNMKPFKLSFFLLLLYIVSCRPPVEKADQIYLNGTILTMEPAQPQVEAVAVRDGKILARGSQKDILKFKGDSTMVINLEGKTMMPGFIDPHSHYIAAVISTISTNISSPPIDSVRCISDIISKLNALKTRLNLKPGDMLLGMGLDPDQLNEKRYPTILDLDPAFPDNPVVLVHASGHIGVYNTQALKLSGIGEKTPDPPGGIIGRLPGSTKPNGVVYENAWFSTMGKIMVPQAEKLARQIKTECEAEIAKGEKPQALPSDIEKKFRWLMMAGQEMYAKEGYTTIQEGSSSNNVIGLLKMAAKQQLFYLDVVSLVAEDLTDSLVGNAGFTFGKYEDRLIFRGVKFICDGSPQGKTAYLSQPLLPASGCMHDCSGKPNIDPSSLEEGMRACYKNGVPVIAHCNGDAAIQMIIDAHEKVIAELGLPDTNRGTVVIHAQFIRPDQLSKFKQHHIFPSFFTNHCYYWGDVHIKNMGRERAFFLSPLRAALDSGIVFSNHTDFNVTPVNALFTVWTAVNRVSRTGVVIGPDQCISPYEALKAITINSAIELGEQNSKGSIVSGKLADFVILSDNPLTVDPMKIRDIKVVETIKEGKPVYHEQINEPK